MLKISANTGKFSGFLIINSFNYSLVDLGSVFYVMVLLCHKLFLKFI